MIHVNIYIYKYNTYNIYYILNCSHQFWRLWPPKGVCLNILWSKKHVILKTLDDGRWKKSFVLDCQVGTVVVGKWCSWEPLPSPLLPRNWNKKHNTIWHTSNNKPTLKLYSWSCHLCHLRAPPTFREFWGPPHHFGEPLHVCYCYPHFPLLPEPVQTPFRLTNPSI